MELRIFLAIGPAFAFFTVLLVWSLTLWARFGVSGARGAWERLARLPSSRSIMVFLVISACANVSFSALAGYINPRDYVQDVVAARQFLRHATMYPDDAPQMGVIELSAPVKGRSELQRLPVIRHELDTLNDLPIPANVHPPALGIAMAAPVFFLGLRGSFLFVL